MSTRILRTIKCKILFLPLFTASLRLQQPRRRTYLPTAHVIQNPISSLNQDPANNKTTKPAFSPTFFFFLLLTNYISHKPTPRSSPSGSWTKFHLGTRRQDQGWLGWSTVRLAVASSKSLCRLTQSTFFLTVWQWKVESMSLIYWIYVELPLSQEQGSGRASGTSSPGVGTRAGARTPPCSCTWTARTTMVTRSWWKTTWRGGRASRASLTCGSPPGAKISPFYRDSVNWSSPLKHVNMYTPPPHHLSMLISHFASHVSLAFRLWKSTPRQ